MADERMTPEEVHPDIREIHPVLWPGEDKEISFLILRCDEIQEAHFDTVNYFKKKNQPMDGVNYEEFQREKERREVFRMVLQLGSKLPSDRLFKTPEELRRKLSLDEVSYFQFKHRTFTEEKIKTWKLEAETDGNE